MFVFVFCFSRLLSKKVVSAKYKHLCDCKHALCSDTVSQLWVWFCGCIFFVYHGSAVKKEEKRKKKRLWKVHASLRLQACTLQRHSFAAISLVLWLQPPVMPDGCLSEYPWFVESLCSYSVSKKLPHSPAHDAREAGKFRLKLWVSRRRQRGSPSNWSNVASRRSCSNVVLSGICLPTHGVWAGLA